MVKNKPSCWGYIRERKDPKVKWDGMIIPDCPCRLVKSCTRRSDAFTGAILGAIRNPKSR